VQRLVEFISIPRTDRQQSGSLFANLVSSYSVVAHCRLLVPAINSSESTVKIDWHPDESKFDSDLNSQEHSPLRYYFNQHSQS
jgi:hypothetical protein